MDQQQLEAAARELCALRGLFADAVVNPPSVFPMAGQIAGLKQRQWQLLVPEILAAWQAQQAIKKVMG